MSSDRKLNVERLDGEPDERDDPDDWDELDAPADLDLSPEAWRLPLSLRIVSFMFILTGILGITEMVLRMAVFGGLYLDFFAIIAIFIGRGLRRWSDTSRRWAVFFSWLFIIAASLLGGLSIADVAFGLGLDIRAYIGSRPVEAKHAIVLSAFAIAYFVWQLRVLRRSDIIRRFQMMRFAGLKGDEGRDPLVAKHLWQFSLSSLMMVMAVTAFVLARVGSESRTEHRSETTTVSIPATRTVTLYRAEYAVRTKVFGPSREELLYLVLTRGENVLGNVEKSGSGYYQRATLVLPDGTTEPLPGKRQLYEIVHGSVRTTDERVSIDEFRSFKSSRTSEWSIDALLKHVEKMRREKQQGIDR